VIDHRRGAHDDRAIVVAGCLVAVAQQRRRPKSFAVVEAYVKTYENHQRGCEITPGIRDLGNGHFLINGEPHYDPRGL
jgi:hypothetical protein